MHHAGVGVTFVFPPFGLITKHQQLGLSTRAFTCGTVTPKLTFFFLTYLVLVTHSKKIVLQLKEGGGHMQDWENDSI